MEATLPYRELLWVISNIGLYLPIGICTHWLLAIVYIYQYVFVLIGYWQLRH